MSVTTWHELWKDRSATYSDDNGNVAREYIRVFQVRTNNKNDDATVIAAYEHCPELGEAHPNDDTALATDLRFDNLEGEPESWYVTVTYSTASQLERAEANPEAGQETPQGGEAKQQNKSSTSDNPEDYPTEYTSTLEPYEEILITHYGAEAAPDLDSRVLNSSFETFDPLLTYTAYLINLTVTKRVPLKDYSLAAGLLTMGMINSEPYLGFEVGTALLSGQSATIMQEKGEVFWKVSTTVKIKLNKVSAVGVTQSASAWEVWVYDMGFSVLDDAGEPDKIREHGAFLASPVPLDGNGNRANTPAILKFQPHMSLHFGGLTYL